VPTIDSHGTWIRFEQYGEPTAPTVLLIHGFASSADDNWVQTGWVRALTKAGRRVVTVDCRGHGKSDKPHDPAAYGHDRMAADVEEVLRYANARTADVIGYSMGSFIALRLLERKPGRIRSAILGGVGEGMLRQRPGREAVAAAPRARRERGHRPRARVPRLRRGPRNDRSRSRRSIRAGHPARPDALAKLRLPILVLTGRRTRSSAAPRSSRRPCPARGPRSCPTPTT
jgi:pimeloyl-ACP methyl ester carboxylesterase